MPRDDTVVLIKDYGKINLKLKEVMESRGMTRYALARAIHARFEVVDKWHRNDVEKIDADVLARICYVLRCQVADIVEYTELEMG